MCIKFTHYLPKKRKLGIEYSAFFGPFVQMLITKSVPNSSARRCSYDTTFLIIVLYVHQMMKICPKEHLKKYILFNVYIPHQKIFAYKVLNIKMVEKVKCTNMFSWVKTNETSSLMSAS